MKEVLNAFVSEWASHGNQLFGAADVLHNRFVVIALDESKAGASGCSIDSSVRCVKHLGETFSIHFFDRLNVWIEQSGAWKRVHFGSLRDYPDWNVFDPLIQDLDALRNAWNVSVSDFMNRLASQ